MSIAAQASAKSITPPALSSVNAKNAANAGGVVNRDNFFSLDERRRQAGISVDALCAASKVDVRTYERLRSGAHAGARPSTIAKLSLALDGMTVAAPAPACTEDLVRVLVALLAALSGADPEKVLAQDLSVQRPQNRDWLEASRLRRFAIYLACVERGLARADLARAIGATRQAIKQTIDAVEALRDEDPGVCAFLDRAARIWTGAGT